MNEYREFIRHNAFEHAISMKEDSTRRMQLTCDKRKGKACMTENALIVDAIVDY